MNIDFETYSEAGYVFDGKRWWGIAKNKSGLNAVGTWMYSRHHSTEVLSMSYGEYLWFLGMPPPTELFDYIRRGGVCKAWHSFFEYCIWNNVCVTKLGWPRLSYSQLECTMARSNLWAAPAKLKTATELFNPDKQKDKEGIRLINKFSKPRSPTKKDKRLRILPSDDPQDFDLMLKYNVSDTKAEHGIGQIIPPFGDFEKRVWLLDQKINIRGVQIDVSGFRQLRYLRDYVEQKYNKELYDLTEGEVENTDKLPDLKKWVNARGVNIPDMQKSTIEEFSNYDWIHPDARRALRLRAYLNSRSITKLDTIHRLLDTDGRIRGLYNYAKAGRTRRWAGQDVQPQNIASSGPVTYFCSTCKSFTDAQGACPECKSTGLEERDWDTGIVEFILGLRDAKQFVKLFSYATQAISGCLRSLFVAKPDHRLVVSDFSAIEAVVLAMLAGEQWRIDVFRTHGKIYEMSAAKISGISFEEIIRYKQKTGKNHPLRKKIGKIAELASGYGGWIPAWKAFGADKHFENDEDIRSNILKWREDSPLIVEFWGGQLRKHPYRWEFKREYFGAEGCAVQAILNPGGRYAYRYVEYCVENDVLYCTLPSGGRLCYHRPRLDLGIDAYSKQTVYKISYEGMNNNPKFGPNKWMRLPTYGGKLVENITQAVARDIQACSLLEVEKGGYPVVMHTHDEIISEVFNGYGSIDQFEMHMSTMPSWASGWPVSARGGWEGYRYRKG